VRDRIVGVQSDRKCAGWKHLRGRRVVRGGELRRAGKLCHQSDESGRLSL